MNIKTIIIIAVIHIISGNIAKAVVRGRNYPENKQTAVIREKIKNECGERGQRWYLELMERAGK